MRQTDKTYNCCEICGYKLEGYAEHETVCGACLDDMEADDDSEVTA